MYYACIILRVFTGKGVQIHSYLHVRARTLYRENMSYTHRKIHACVIHASDKQRNTDKRDREMGERRTITKDGKIRNEN